MEPKEFTPAGLSQKDEYVTNQRNQAISNPQNQGSKKTTGDFRKSRREQREFAPQAIPRKVTTFPSTTQSPRQQTSEKYKTADNVRRPKKQSYERSDRKMAASDRSPKRPSNEMRDRKRVQFGRRRDQKVTASDRRPIKQSSERRGRETRKQAGGRRDQKMTLPREPPSKSPNREIPFTDTTYRPKTKPSEIYNEDKSVADVYHPSRQTRQPFPDTVQRTSKKKLDIKTPRSSILLRRNEKRYRITPFSENLRRSREKSESERSLSDPAHHPSAKQTKNIFSEISTASDRESSSSDTIHPPSEKRNRETSLPRIINRSRKQIAAKDETPTEQRINKQRLGQDSKIHAERDKATIVYGPKKQPVANVEILTSKQRPQQSSIHPERDGKLSSPNTVYRPKKQPVAKAKTLTSIHRPKQSPIYPEHTSLHKVASKSVDRKQDFSKKRRKALLKDPGQERRPSMLVSWLSKMNLTKNVITPEIDRAPSEAQLSSEMISDKSTQKLFTYRQRESDKDWSKDLLQETDYDPHEFRESDYQTSNAEALLLMIKVCLGTGIFTMPEAYKYAGLFYGVVSTFWVITFMTYGISTLIKCQYLLCKRLKIPSITYPDTLVAALTIGPKNLRRYARNSGNFLAFLILLNRFFNCTVYIIFLAKHMKAIIDLHTTKKLALEVYMVFLTIPLSIISSVRSIKFLAPIAMAANVCMLVSIGVILAYMVTSLPELHANQGIGKIWDLPLALSTTMFAFDSVTSVAVLQNTMKEPKAFVGFFGVFSISILILSISFTCIGFFGYWRFGDTVKSLMTMDLPANESICQVIIILSALAVWASYSLQVFVPIYYMSRLLRSMPNSYAWEYLLRVCWVIFPLILAASVPELKIIIPFFGSLCGPLLQFGFPALIEFCLKYSDTLTYGRWIAVVDILIIIYALTGVVTGLHSTATGVYRGRFRTT